MGGRLHIQAGHTMTPRAIPLSPAARALIIALARHAAAMEHEREPQTQKQDQKAA